MSVLQIAAGRTIHCKDTRICFSAPLNTVSGVATEFPPRWRAAWYLTMLELAREQIMHLVALLSNPNLAGCTQAIEEDRSIREKSPWHSRPINHCGSAGHHQRAKS